MLDRFLAGLRVFGMQPDRERAQAVIEFAEKMLEQNQVMNLTAITQPEDVVRFHLLDSAAVLAYGGSPGWLTGKRVIDVGTGAGFPGVVLRLLEPSLQLTLLDSLGKRMAWLERLGREQGLDHVDYCNARAEEQAQRPGYRNAFDVAVSRAVASLPRLTELCLPFVKPGGVFLAMKSVLSDEEIQDSRRAVETLGGTFLPHVDYTLPGSDTQRRLIRIQKVHPTPKGFPRAWPKIKKSPL